MQPSPVQVLLVSAQEALLSRLMLRQSPQPAPAVLQRFKERAFGSSRAVQRRTFAAAELRAAAQDMLEDSGQYACLPRSLHIHCCNWCTFPRHVCCCC